MPLIVFVGISSLGALFLMVFLASIFRDDRHRAHAQKQTQEKVFW